MRVLIFTPAGRGSRSGNRVTALRYAAQLRRLGHQATFRRVREPDLAIALHATKSAEFLRSLHGVPTVLVLTGTDIYGTLTQEMLASLETAWRIVVLQPLAMEALPAQFRSKARVIVQSASAAPDAPPPSTEFFDLCVVGHLRKVKDPFRAADAARLLPASSRIRVLHLGAALDVAMRARAREEERRNPRYRWLGEQPRRQTLRILASCRLLLLASRLEGGANVVCEALAAGVPVLASDVPGNTGILGRDYPGLFPFGDTQALAALMARAEGDAAFLGTLRAACSALHPLVDPARERNRWAELLIELPPAPGA